MHHYRIRLAQKVSDNSKDVRVILKALALKRRARNERMPLGMTLRALHTDGNNTDIGQMNYYSNIEKFTPRTLLNERIIKLNRLILDILMSLNIDGLDEMKIEFEQHENSELDIEEFVELMLEKCPPSTMVDRSDIVEALVELFDSMDLDGNKSLDFDEFLETIINWGLSTGGINNTRVLDDPILPFSVGPSITMSRRLTLKKMKYVEVLDRIIVLEPMRFNVKVVDPDTLETERCVHLNRRDVTAFEYIHSDSSGWQCKLIAFAVPKKILLWEGLSTGKFSQQSEISTRIKACKMSYLQNLDLLILGAQNGSIYAWSLKHENHLVARLQGHSIAITAMILIPKSTQLVTGSVDRKVSLWDFSVRKKKHCKKFVYMGYHQAAISALGYSGEHNVIVSGDRDGSICVWSSTDRHILFKLTQHNSAINFVGFPPGSPIFVSSDNQGNMKTWDIRLSFQCGQEILLAGAHGTPVLCPKRDTRIVVPSDIGLQTIDQHSGHPNMRRKRQLPVRQTEWLIASSFNPKQLEFVTATPSKIRTWNALTGCLKAEFCHLMPGNADIAAMCFDPNQRKMIIGDNKGVISVFNAMSGCWMKALEAHKGSIIDLHYINEYRTVVSLGADHVLKTHDETPISLCPVRMRVDLDAKGIKDPTCLATSFDLNLCAVGDHNGVVGMWDLEVSVGVEMLCGHDAAITAIAFLGNWPLCVTACQDAWIMVWLLRPNVQHGQCVTRLKVPTGEVVSMQFDVRNNLLVCGDSFGFVTLYDIREVIEASGVERVDILAGDQRIRINSFRSIVARELTRRGRIEKNERERMDAAMRERWTRAKVRLVRQIELKQPLSRLGLITDPASFYVQNLNEKLSVLGFDGKKLGELGAMEKSRRSVQRHEWLFKINAERHMADSDRTVQKIIVKLREADLEKEASEAINRNLQAYGMGASMFGGRKDSMNSALEFNNLDPGESLAGSDDENGEPDDEFLRRRSPQQALAFDNVEQMSGLPAIAAGNDAPSVNRRPRARQSFLTPHRPESIPAPFLTQTLYDSSTPKQPQYVQHACLPSKTTEHEEVDKPSFAKLVCQPRSLSPPFHDVKNIRRSQSENVLLSKTRRDVRLEYRNAQVDSRQLRPGTSRHRRRNRREWLLANCQPRKHDGPFVNDAFDAILALPCLRKGSARRHAQRLQNALAN